MSKLWGTMESSDTKVAPIDYKRLTKPQALELEGPPLHQPCARSATIKNDKLPSTFTVDPLVSHSIEMLQYIRTLQTLISNGQQTMDSYMIDDTAGTVAPTLPEAPPMPVFENPTTSRKNMPFYVPEETDFSNGIGEAPMEIDNNMCHSLLRKSVAVLCAHLGFESCNESVLEELTDATSLYYKRLTSMLRQYVDADSSGVQVQQQDWVEKVLVDCGIGGVEGIHDFYSNRVVNYQQHLITTAEQLLESYKAIQTTIKNKTPPVAKEEPGLTDISFGNGIDIESDFDLNTSVSLDMNIEAVEMSQKRALLNRGMKS